MNYIEVKYVFKIEDLQNIEQIRKLAENGVEVLEQNLNIQTELVNFEEIKSDISDYKKLNQIRSFVSFETGITIEHMKSENRKAAFVSARHLYFLLSRMFTKLSLEKIGHGTLKDHATVLHGLKKMKGVNTSSEVVRIKEIVEKMKKEYNKTLWDEVNPIKFEVLTIQKFR